VNQRSENNNTSSKRYASALSLTCYHFTCIALNADWAYIRTSIESLVSSMQGGYSSLTRKERIAGLSPSSMSWWAFRTDDLMTRSTAWYRPWVGRAESRSGRYC